MANNKTNGYDDEEMTVELELDDGQTVNCAIITIEHHAGAGGR